MPFITAYQRTAEVDIAGRANATANWSASPQPAPELHSEIVSDFARLELLSDDWERLRRAGRRPEIFASFPFARACWRSFARARQLCTVIVFRGDEPVAILPLTLTPEERLVRFLTAPETDYNDILTHADAPPEYLSAALAAVAKSRLRWSRCQFENVPEDSNFVHLNKGLPRSLARRLVLVGQTPCPTLLLEGSREPIDVILRNARHRKVLKQMEKLGDLRFRHLEDRAEALRHLPQFLRQHQERWAIAPVGSAGDYATQQSLCEALIDELGTERVRFAALELDGAPIAYHFGFEDDRKFIFYKQALDIDRWYSSPGRALLVSLLHYAREQQLNELDLGVGDEAYKSRYANAVRFNSAYTLYRSPLPALATRGVMRIKAHPRLWSALKRMWLGLRGYARRLARLRRRKGFLGVLGWMARRALRAAAAKDEVLVFVRTLHHDAKLPGGGSRTPDLEIRPGRLSELAWLAREHADDFDPARLTAARDRLKGGDKLFFALVGGEIAHVAWLSTRQEITAEAELGPQSRVPTAQPIALIDDCWTAPQWRGRGIYAAVLDELGGCGSREHGMAFVCCLAANEPSRRGIESAGFQPVMRMRRWRFLQAYETRSVIRTSPEIAAPLAPVAPNAPPP